MTQQSFAEKIPVNRVTVGDWETGASLPGTDKLDSIANALGVEVWQLCAPAELSQECRKTKDIQECLITLMEYTKNKICEDMQRLNLPPDTIDLFSREVTKKVTPPPSAKA